MILEEEQRSVELSINGMRIVVVYDLPRCLPMPVDQFIQAFDDGMDYVVRIATERRGLIDVVTAFLSNDHVFHFSTQMPEKTRIRFVESAFSMEAKISLDD